MKQTDIQHEAERTSYALRSSFYYRLNSQWPEVLRLLEHELSLQLDWSERAGFGISELAWDRVTATNANPALVFCHPDIIVSKPRLITYFRCLALLPQKGMQRLAFAPEQYESGQRGTLSKDRAMGATVTLNGLICLLIESVS